MKTKNAKVQTDEQIEEDIVLFDDDSEELVSFMRRIGPAVLQELEKNNRSHAFDGYRVSWQEEVDTVSRIHSLSHEKLNHELQVTGLSWNCTGAVIAVAYGRLDHENWCTHKSALCTWNIDRSSLNSSKPDTVIDLSSCLLCVACHPKQPSLIAGATFNGEVMVWDTSREDETLVATSGISDDTHREPVYKLQWVAATDSKKYNLVSVGGDGRILVWHMSSRKQTLKLVDGFILLTESLPRKERLTARRGDKEMAVTSLTFSPNDETTFLVGSDSGGIFKCSTKTKGTPASRDVQCSIPLQSPVTFSFASHKGPVYSVDFSHFHRNLFLSCSTDKSVRIYTVLQSEPVLTLEPGAEYLYSAKWSPVRPLLFAVGAHDGTLLIYDLRQNRATPTLRLDAGAKKEPVFSVEFSHAQPQLLATGDAAGNVAIWRLNSELTQQQNHEQEMLDELADVVHE
ncbi:hypothetical protein NP493_1930g00018 [Ridgeia piscesae]|uniref:WD repeat-containing protein 34 n=1 Tax=Ridgeia piscesae TaxID=27915 RepID=A0AAD9JPP1_RIDPI|nr:hypothetical protein NP493_1930g00018 [Ridgeia piscesae]